MKPLIAFLLKDRPYQTLDSISNCPEYSIFKHYIEFEKEAFQDFTKNDFDNKITNLYKIIQNNIDDKVFIQYTIDLLLYFFGIRPHTMEFPSSFFAFLIFQQNNLQKIITETIQTNSLLKESSNNYIQNILYANGLITNKPPDYDAKKNSLYDIYKKESLHYILQEDDFESLKKYMTLKKIEKELILPYNSPMYQQTKKRNVLLLGFCAYYGSINCFKFLLSMKHVLDSSAVEMSIAGGNQDIIKIIEQNGHSLNTQFTRSVQYHHYEISEYLLSHYKCESFSLSLAMQYYDFRSFLFLILNGADPNHGVLPPITSVCLYAPNVNAVKLLLQKGAEMGKSSLSFTTGYTPLTALCYNRMNYELLDFLIDNGADINQTFKKGDLFYTPLSYLCSTDRVDFEALKIFIEKGADINFKGFTPLCAVCSHSANVNIIQFLIDNGADVNLNNPLSHVILNPKFNIEAFKLLVENGANVNQEFINSEMSSLTPLAYFCIQEKRDMTLIQYLLDKGADINRKFKLCIDSKKLQTVTYTLLVYFCNQDNVDISMLKFLLDHGARPGKPVMNDNKAQAPITYLFMKSVNLEAIQLFLDHGATIDGNTMALISSRGITSIYAFLDLKEGPTIGKNFNIKNYNMNNQI